MKKITIFLFIFSLKIVSAQDPLIKVTNTSTSFNLGGSGMRYSFGICKNLTLWKNNIYLTPGAKISFYRKTDFAYFAFPLSLSFSVRVKKNLLAEAGLDYFAEYFWFKSYLHPEDGWRAGGSDDNLFPAAGLKFQKKQGGITLGCRFLFVFNSERFDYYGFLVDLPFPKVRFEKWKFVPWPEISIGYTFPRHN